MQYDTLPDANQLLLSSIGGSFTSVQGSTYLHSRFEGLVTVVECFPQSQHRIISYSLDVESMVVPTDIRTAYGSDAFSCFSIVKWLMELIDKFRYNFRYLLTVGIGHFAQRGDSEHAAAMPYYHKPWSIVRYILLDCELSASNTACVVYD